MRDKILSLLGFAARSRKIVSGARRVERALRDERIFLLLASKEMSQHTVDRLNYHRNIPVIKVYSAEQLSRTIGKANRHIIGITDPAMAKVMLEFSKQEAIFDKNPSV